MKNTVGLKIGIYISKYRGTVHLGGASFFDILIRGFNEQIFNKRSKILLICDDIHDLNNYNTKNLSIIQVPKSYHNFNDSDLSAKKIGKVFFRILRLLRYMLHKWYKTNVPSFQASRESIFENLIDENQIDLMIYANQFSLPTINRPYIWIMWDLACRNINFFYKMDQSNSNLAKLRYASSNAFRIITANEAGLKDIAKYLLYPKNRIRCVPFPVPDNLKFADVTEPKEEFSNYIFYPALLTPHKNHYVLLQALNIIKAKGYKLNLVLTGKDCGNFSYINSLVRELKLEKDVHYLGVVPIEQLKWLYKNATALVYPAYLGPNSFPPVEAMSLGVPVIASDIEGHREQLKENALYFDPKCANSLVERIEILNKNNDLRERIVESGKLHVKNLTSQNYAKKLLEITDEFIPYRYTYK
jgi:glycosyltransferase involved in cell wall biosynthesis